MSKNGCPASFATTEPISLLRSAAPAAAIGRCISPNRWQPTFASAAMYWCAIGSCQREYVVFTPLKTFTAKDFLERKNRVLHMNKPRTIRSEEHTSELQSPDHLVCRLLLEKKKTDNSQS